MAQPSEYFCLLTVGLFYFDYSICDPNIKRSDSIYNNYGMGYVQVELPVGGSLTAALRAQHIWRQ